MLKYSLMKAMKEENAAYRLDQFSIVALVPVQHPGSSHFRIRDS